MSTSIQSTLALVLTSAVFGLALRADARTFEADSASAWAGAYRLNQPNSSMTQELIITPESGFQLIEGGCFGSFPVNHGSVTYRNGVLELNPKFPVEQGSTFESGKLLPISFREKRYLVSADRVGEFVATTHGGSGDCAGACAGFFVRESDME
jgi:hypothetical protein